MRSLFNRLSFFIHPHVYLYILAKYNRFRKRTVNINFLLNLISKKNADFFFVQIGANDGMKNDPIFNFVKEKRWRGILVEPLPTFFGRLKANYSSQGGLKFENVGISNVRGTMEFYYMPEEINNPEWLQQIGSFDRRAIEFNLENHPELIAKIASRNIDTVTLKDLLERNNVSKIDLLVVDTEGFEYKILAQLEGINIQPEYILFEWGCLTSEDLSELKALLSKLKYSLFESGGDIVAVRKYRFAG